MNPSLIGKPHETHPSEKKKSLFQRCREIDCSDITHQNYQGINYVSWADMHKKLYENFPEAKIDYAEFPEGKDNIIINVPYLKTELGVFVRCSVTIEGVTMTEDLPVMDKKMQSVAMPSANDINKNRKRCFVKACALHGLGLSLYEKDDLFAESESSSNAQQKQNKPDLQTPARAVERSKRLQKGGEPISPKQVARLLAIAANKGWVNVLLTRLVSEWGYASFETIGWKDYGDIVNEIEMGPTAPKTVVKTAEEPPPIMDDDLDIPF